MEPFNITLSGSVYLFRPEGERGYRIFRGAQELGTVFVDPFEERTAGKGTPEPDRAFPAAAARVIALHDW